MGFFFPDRSVAEQLAVAKRHGERLESELGVLRSESGLLLERYKASDSERFALEASLLSVHPGMDPRELSEAILQATREPFDLSCFFIASMDWTTALLHFHLYYEGGKARHIPPFDTRSQSSMSMVVLETGKPLYIPSNDADGSQSAYLTAAEKASGLIPETFYGVPFGFGTRPAGLVSFQAYARDAFNETRRGSMDALARLVGLVLTDGLAHQA